MHPFQHTINPQQRCPDGLHTHTHTHTATKRTAGDDGASPDDRKAGSAPKESRLPPALLPPPRCPAPLPPPSRASAECMIPEASNHSEKANDAPGPTLDIARDGPASKADMSVAPGKNNTPWCLSDPLWRAAGAGLKVKNKLKTAAGTGFLREAVQCLLRQVNQAQ